MVEGECWLWAGATNAAGYGIHGHRGLAHRSLYEALVGQVPEGLQLDHLCRIPRCVNPAHMEVVTPAENVRRGKARMRARAAKLNITQCPRGHHYTLKNTYKSKANRRICRECTKLNMRKYRLIRKRG